MTAKPILACMLIMGLGCAQAPAETGESWKNPIIEEYGKVRPYPDSAVQPEPGREYKILFDVTEAADSPDKVNPGFEHVARLINLFAWSGVPVEELKIVLVVHGSATSSVLQDEHYRKEHQVANPNTGLIAALKQAGVTLYVCGQALAHNGFETVWVNPDVTLSLAALTVLPLYQLEGYVLIPD